MWNAKEESLNGGRMNKKWAGRYCGEKQKRKSTRLEDNATRVKSVQRVRRGGMR